MFERPEGGERAVLVHLEFPDDEQREALAEFRELVAASGARPVEVITGGRRAPDPRYFIGSGKAEQIRRLIAGDGRVDLVLFNHALSPAQERNLERLFQCRVLDRTGLILDIFAQRARSHEGKLQVELAQLRHISTRLVRGWTHLERQKGGIGLRGPGETQLETDRRLLAERIKYLRRRLEKVRHQREQGRRSRRRAEVATVSLVGYTNVGKSSLFNRLTRARVYAADQLFATLDPTLRRLELGNGCSAVLADTVGFIRHLPHHLVAAFRSTLQESRDAQLLLHVVDAGDPLRHEKMEQVNRVLKEIGAERVPQIEVYNKSICWIMWRRVSNVTGTGGRGAYGYRRSAARVWSWCAARWSSGLAAGGAGSVSGCRLRKVACVRCSTSGEWWWRSRLREAEGGRWLSWWMTDRGSSCGARRVSRRSNISLTVPRRHRGQAATGKYHVLVNGVRNGLE